MATEVKFTKGPWVVDQHFSERQGGRTYAHLFGSGAQLGAVIVGADGYGAAEGWANARLIAAAPDLYEALSDVIRPYGIADIAINNTAGSDLDAFLELYRRIQAALNKANPSPA